MAWFDIPEEVLPHIEKWIKKVKDVCIEESVHTGIYPSIIIAQTILESFAGTSDLAVNHYNFTGMNMPEELLGQEVTFWDGQVYRRKNHVFDRSWADYTQAGDCDSGFILCIRHYGWNIWATDSYAENGVLDHISAGLSFSEARADAKTQMHQLVSIYAPIWDNNEGYEEMLLTIIDEYNLWECDKEFLLLGGWNGNSPYSLN